MFIELEQNNSKWVIKASSIIAVHYARDHADCRLMLVLDKMGDSFASSLQWDNPSLEFVQSFWKQFEAWRLSIEHCTRADCGQ